MRGKPTKVHICIRICPPPPYHEREPRKLFAKPVSLPLSLCILWRLQSLLFIASWKYLQLLPLPTALSPLAVSLTTLRIFAAKHFMARFIYQLHTPHLFKQLHLPTSSLSPPLPLSLCACQPRPAHWQQHPLRILLRLQRRLFNECEFINLE